MPAITSVYTDQMKLRFRLGSGLSSLPEATDLLWDDMLVFKFSKMLKMLAVGD